MQMGLGSHNRLRICQCQGIGTGFQLPCES
jgi:hypothetical protein